mgnify:CR=1 FL=1
MGRRRRREHHDVYVVDDGTMDTVLSIDGIEHRFSGDAMRRHQTGRRMYEPYQKDIDEQVQNVVDSDERYWKKKKKSGHFRRSQKTSLLGRWIR